MARTTKRPYDIVVFGATGFTGRLVVDYLCGHADAASLSWAIAGRSAEKLSAIASDLRDGQGEPLSVDTVIADSGDWDSLEAMTQKTRVLLSTVGPYVQYGEPLVEACVATGTDYLDITGEPAFVHGIREQFDESAKDAGVLLVSCCGFDSIPADLGVLYTRQQVPDEASVTIRSYVKAKGQPSGGTWASLITILADGAVRSGPRPTGARSVRARQKSRFHRHEERGSWVIPMPVIDPSIVRRSAALRGDYGPDFHYEQYYETESLLTAGGLAAGVAGLFLLSQFEPTRQLLLNQRPSGSGPSVEEREKGFFRVEFVAEWDGERVVTQVRGGDPGYTETAKMVAESALALACQRDQLPLKRGVATPASALGDVLRERLENAGIVFEVLT
jgi:short subunit dehydrogenase-like uncharacterized protein